MLSSYLDGANIVDLVKFRIPNGANIMDLV